MPDQSPEDPVRNPSEHSANSPPEEAARPAPFEPGPDRPESLADAEKRLKAQEGMLLGLRGERLREDARQEERDRSLDQLLKACRKLHDELRMAKAAESQANRRHLANELDSGLAVLETKVEEHTQRYSGKRT